MVGELPCLDTSTECIRQLQEKAIANGKALRAIDERVEAINSKIEEAKKNNQSTVKLGVFKPLVQAYLKDEVVQTPQGPKRRGFLDRIFSVFSNPINGINEILSLVGIPLFENATGGNDAAQQRAIAISDLQVKVAEVERQRGELADKIREQVVLQVLDFETIRREFQISQEIAKRETARLKLLEVDYRFGTDITSNTYLGAMSGLNRQQGDTLRAWAKLRSQLARIKLLVLGVEGE